MATRVRAYGLALAFGLLGAPAVFAAPWAEPGDRRLRSDLELLADYGVLGGPVTSWPIPWAQVSASLSLLGDRALPLHVQRALSRVERLMPGLEDRRGIQTEIGVSATNKPTLIRDFGGSARGDGDGYIRVERQWSSTYVSARVGYRDDPRNGDKNFDGSYLAQAIGNWAVYGGYMEQWWGSGWESSLIFSTNARPLPKVGFKRLEPRPFETKWLNWLGPWQFESFVSLVDERREISDHIIAGIRLTFKPIDKLEIGFTRAMQLCGEGRSCGFGTWRKALIPFTGAENTGTTADPGNQLASGDFRYGWSRGDSSYSLYGEIMGEDEIAGFFDKISVNLGGTMTRPWGEEGAFWRLGLEYTDTLANRILGPLVTNQPGVSFAHFIFTDGFTYRGRVIGPSIGGDARSVSLTGLLTDSLNRSYRLSLRHAGFNKFGLARTAFVSANKETMRIVEGEVNMPTPWGDVQLELRVQDDDVNTPGRSPIKAAVEVGWRTRF